MKTKFSSLVLLLLCVASLKASTGDETPVWLQKAAAIKLPTYEKDVPAVVLVDDSTTTVDADGKLTEAYNYAVRIIRREGREYAVGEVGYIPDAGKVKDFRAWLIRPSGDVKHYGKDDMVDVAAALNDVYNEYRLKRIVGTSDTEEGAVFGYSYVREERSVFSQADWFFQNEIPVINSRYSLTLPSGWRAEGITFNHANVEPRINGSTYVWELSNLPQIPHEPLSPSIRNLVAHLAVSYYPPANAQSVPIKTFSNWGDVATWMSELEDPQVQVDDALARKAYELTALAKTEYEKIQAIAAYVQHIQYISIQTGIGPCSYWMTRSWIPV